MKKRDKTKADIPSVDWYDQRTARDPKNPAESFRYETMDLSKSWDVEIKEPTPPLHPIWHDDWIAVNPVMPTESFRYEILDLSKPREVEIEEPVRDLN